MAKKLNIDPEQVKDLARIGATVREIADFFHCSDTSINNKFQKQLVQGRAEMKMNLRRAQLRVAIEKDNATLLIWLGKQMLHQTDVPTDLTNKETAEQTKQIFLDEIKQLIKPQPPKE